MNTADRYNLDEYFEKARSVPPVTSEDDLLSLLDGATPGQRAAHQEQLTDISRNGIRGVTMKTIAIGVIAATLGSTAFYLNYISNDAGSSASLSPQPTMQNATTRTLPAQPRIANIGADSRPAPTLPELPEKHAKVIHHRTPDMDMPAPITNQPAVKNQDGDKPTANNMGLDSALWSELGKSLSKVAEQYWVEKINNYKVTIDHLMSPKDLDDLNRLRVRWSILSANSDGDGRGMNMKMMVGHDGMVNDASDNDAAKKHKMEVKLGASSKNGGKVQSKTSINGQEIDGSGMDQAQMAQMAEGIMNMMVASGDERAITFKGAKDLAATYRPGFDALKTTVFNDITSFMGTIAQHVHQFINDHRDKLTDAQADSIMNKMAELHHGMNLDELKSALDVMYDFIGEPMLMLYNGSDIGGLVPASIASPVPGMKMSESTTLSQNYPNPASSTTSISYTLLEPSPAAVLRLYDASGKLLRTIDQGAQTAGEHTATLDVSDLTTGAYLYHLTIQTSKGEQVFSKTLQVTR